MKLENLIKAFDIYCENNIECNRICPSDIYIECFLNYLINNYNIEIKN